MDCLWKITDSLWKIPGKTLNFILEKLLATLKLLLLSKQQTSWKTKDSCCASSVFSKS